MKILTKIFLAAAFCVLSASFAAAQKKVGKGDKFLTEGTYGNITTGEGGDMGGMQIYLTDSDGQFYVLVTIAEGIKQAPVLVKAKANIAERIIEFTLPGKRQFKALVEADGMTLIESITTKTADGLKLSDNNEQFLKRLCQK